MKSPHHDGDQPEHQSIDDQQEKPKGQDRDGKGEKDQYGLNDGINDSQQKSADQGRPETIHPDQSWEKIGDYQDGHHVDDQADDDKHKTSLKTLLFIPV
jgi:hypothetical protein